MILPYEEVEGGEGEEFSLRSKSCEEVSRCWLATLATLSEAVSFRADAFDLLPAVTGWLRALLAQLRDTLRRMEEDFTNDGFLCSGEDGGDLRQMGPRWVWLNPFCCRDSLSGSGPCEKFRVSEEDEMDMVAVAAMKGTRLVRLG